MVKTGILKHNEIDVFQGNIKTVATEFASDVIKWRNGHQSDSDFFNIRQCTIKLDLVSILK